MANQPLRSSQETSYSSMLASLFLGSLLLAAGFFAGWYWQQSTLQDLVRVEVVPHTEGLVPVAEAVTSEEGLPNPEPTLEQEEVSAEDCLFIGSKNSDKYHTPESAPAKRIKEENKVCFASAEAAEEEGYTPGTLE